jgi:hypothetical protein
MRNLFWSPAIGFRGLVPRNAVDAGGPGGPTGDVSSDAGQGAGGDADASSSDAQGQGQVPDSQASAADADPFEDSDDPDDATAHEELRQRDPQTAKRLRKLANRDRVSTPVMQALRAHGIDPRDRKAVGAFLSKAFAPPPAIAPAPPAAPAAPAQQKWTPLRTDEPFDDAPYAAWDQTDASNKALIGSARTAHATAMRTNALANGFMALVDENKALVARIDALEHGHRAKERDAVTTTWRTEVEAGVRAFKDPEAALAFKDAVAGAVLRERNAGRVPDAKGITQAVLKRLQRTGTITPADAARATAAQQGIADRNRSMPTRAALAPGGAPGSPTLDRSEERVRDVSRRNVGRHYVGVR